MRRELTETRRIVLDALNPTERWADLKRPEDVAAMRRLAGAIMGDIRRKRSWGLAWRLATSAAYPALRKHGQYMDDSDHLADMIGAELVSRADMAGLQRLYTLSHAGCSSVMAWDADAGHMVHFRSLDWPSAGAIAGASRILVGQAAGGDVFSAAGILGMAGILTAVKPGFSVAINFAPWRGPSCSLNADPSFLVRNLMASPADSFRQAYHTIAGWRPSAPVFVSLCGIEKGEATIFEFGAAWHRGARVYAISIGDKDCLVQTNHFAPHSPFAAHRVKQAPGYGWDGPEWESHSIRATSQARQALIEQGLRDRAGAGLDDALHRVFARRPVWNRQTAQWVRMEPKTGALRTWVRDEAT